MSAASFKVTTARASLVLITAVLPVTLFGTLKTSEARSAPVAFDVPKDRPAVIDALRDGDLVAVRATDSPEPDARLAVDASSDTAWSGHGGAKTWVWAASFARPAHLGVIRVLWGKAPTIGVPTGFRWEILAPGPDGETCDGTPPSAVGGWTPLSEANQEAAVGVMSPAQPTRRSWFVDASACGLRLVVTATNAGPPVLRDVRAIESARDVLRDGVASDDGASPGRDRRGCHRWDVRAPLDRRAGSGALDPSRRPARACADRSGATRPWLRCDERPASAIRSKLRDRVGADPLRARDERRWHSFRARRERAGPGRRDHSSTAPPAGVDRRAETHPRTPAGDDRSDGRRGPTRSRRRPGRPRDRRVPLRRRAADPRRSLDPERERESLGPVAPCARWRAHGRRPPREVPAGAFRLPPARAAWRRPVSRIRGGQPEAFDVAANDRAGEALESIEGDDPQLDAALLAKSDPPPIAVLSGSNDWDYAPETGPDPAVPQRWHWDPLRGARLGGMGQLARAVRARMSPFLGFCGGAQLLGLLEAETPSHELSVDDEALIDEVLSRATGKPIRGFAPPAECERAWPGDPRPARATVAFDRSDPLFTDLAGAAGRSTTQELPLSHADAVRPDAFLPGGPLRRFEVLATSTFCAPEGIAAKTRDALSTSKESQSWCRTVPQAFRSRDPAWPVIGAQFHAEQRDFAAPAPGDPPESVADPRLFLAAAYELIVDANLRLAP